MIRIASFDVGIKNLSYCILEYPTPNDEEHKEKPEFNILHWQVLSVEESKNVPQTCENLIRVLQDHTQLGDVNRVIIENQPVTKNPKMKTIQVTIMTYFLLKKIQVDTAINEVCLLNSAMKLKAYKGPPIEVTLKSAYSRRKKLAILYTKYELTQIESQSEWLKYLETHKKKDDLSDSFLQALYLLRKKP
jgi:hypothetical protein